MRSTLPRVTVFTLPSPLRAGVHPGPAPRSPVLPASKPPIYRFMFFELFAFLFPPKPYALAAHLALLEEEAGPAPWMIRQAEYRYPSLIGEAVARELADSGPVPH
jgi:hypothetical protein